MKTIGQKILAMGIVMSFGVGTQALMIDNFSVPSSGVYSQTTNWYGSLNVKTDIGAVGNNTNVNRDVMFSGYGGYYNRFASIGINAGPSTSGVPKGYTDSHMLVMQSKGYSQSYDHSMWDLNYNWTKGSLDLAPNTSFTVNFASAGNADQIDSNKLESIVPNLDSTLTLTDANHQTVYAKENVNHSVDGAFALTYSGFTGSHSFNWGEVQNASFALNPQFSCGSNGNSLYSISSVQTNPTPELGSSIVLGLGMTGLAATMLQRRHAKAL